MRLLLCDFLTNFRNLCVGKFTDIRQPLQLAVGWSDYVLIVSGEFVEHSDERQLELRFGYWFALHKSADF